MESNVILEQYGIYKNIELSQSPFRCLLEANIELNPHQISAFSAAIRALKTGGIVLADEVGLGKTIEAGLVLRYVLDSGAKKVLIVVPATLRKQWDIELEDKFSLYAYVLDRYTVEKDYYEIKALIENPDAARIIITSYDYAPKLMHRFPKVKWDFCIVDEAHNLRNVFHGTKRAKYLYDLTRGIPKILLTATPLQNSLSDLHGLISFIDPRIFGNEKAFNRNFVSRQNFDELKHELAPVICRTLRKDVSKYLNFRKRECRTINFTLSQEEIYLYNLVNKFLKRDNLYSFPGKTGPFMILVIRKLLASSSFAIADTFEVLKNRLEKLYEGTKSADAMQGFELFWKYIDDEIDEDELDTDKDDDDDATIKKQQIKEELYEVNRIIKISGQIKENAKMIALKQAIKAAFMRQKELGISEKVVVFTESKRTQKYIAHELRKADYSEDDIVLFNGDFDDAMTKQIYNAWKAKNFGKPAYDRSIEYKHAIVDYFEHNAKILIVTDVGSEGLNMQFCNTVINYDLPWNPQKIEQRIGRCHRYGQKNDVVAINLLNTQNEADKRVYEILSKKFALFDGVFGSSDIALGMLESGSSFEKMILEIYQRCNTASEFKDEFDKLEMTLDAKLNTKATQLRTLLSSETGIQKELSLDNVKENIDRYCREKEFWSEIPDPESDRAPKFWKVADWGMNEFGSHGTIFLGAAYASDKFLFPLLVFFDNEGREVSFTEEELVGALQHIDDLHIKNFTPDETDNELYRHIYDHLLNKTQERYTAETSPVIEYNKGKIMNWVKIQTEQLQWRVNEMLRELLDLTEQKNAAETMAEKKHIQKQIDEKEAVLDRFHNSLPKQEKQIREEGIREIEKFNRQFNATLYLKVNVVVKF